MPQRTRRVDAAAAPRCRGLRAAPDGIAGCIIRPAR
jgi:hypothetical protein